MNEKSVLQQLVLNNTILTTSNESLVALVNKITGDIKNLERENSRLKKGVEVSTRSKTLLQQLQEIGLSPTRSMLRAAKKLGQAPPWLEKRVVTVWDGHHN